MLRGNVMAYVIMSREMAALASIVSEMAAVCACAPTADKACICRAVPANDAVRRVASNRRLKLLRPRRHLIGRRNKDGDYFSIASIA